MLEYEQKLWSSNIRYIAGIDEAGRGPLAGPVVAASVIFPDNIYLPEVNDSKKISEKKRERLFDDIYNNAISIGVGISYEDYIEENNILNATYNAMRISVGNLSVRPDVLLVDGNQADIKHYKQINIISGDNKSISIAAASIIAKVTRDRIMKQYDIIFPEYGFAKHKGYGTKQHINLIYSFKASPVHRKTFNPVSNYLPTFRYYKENMLIDKLGTQIVAIKMIQDRYEILDFNLDVGEEGQIIDIISKYKDIIYFTQVYTIVNNNIDYDFTKEIKDADRVHNAMQIYMINNNLSSRAKYNSAKVILGNFKPKIYIEEIKG